MTASPSQSQCPACVAATLVMTVGRARRPLVTQPLPHDETTLIDALKRRDELAFVQLVGRYQGPLLRLARVYARTRAVAEEIVQDAWVGVLQGIDRFESRSSFKTWLFRILVNRARTRAEREARMVPFSAHLASALAPGAQPRAR